MRAVERTQRSSLCFDHLHSVSGNAEVGAEEVEDASPSASGSIPVVECDEYSNFVVGPFVADMLTMAAGSSVWDPGECSGDQVGAFVLTFWCHSADNDSEWLFMQVFILQINTDGF